MSQVRTGTVDVTNGSQVVTGSGTNWLTSTKINDLFIIQGESVIYRIASVASDTQISLSSDYVGTTATGVAYVIHVDFTTSGIPLMQDGDIETVSIYNLAVVALEQGLAFGTYYLGAFAVAPTETGTGGAITEGMMYFDTATDLLNVYDGFVWYDGAASAIAAAQSAAEAAADAVQTGLDRVQTGLDRVQTVSDAAQTISDAAQTAADRVQTGLDRVQTGLDSAQTVLDAAATAADRVQTGLDAVDTAADVVQTGLDRVQTTADAVQTASDRVQTGLDATQTALDRVQTVADAAQTAADRVQTSADRVQTISDAASTAADRIYVDGVEANVAAIEVSINNTFDTFDDRFLGTFTTDPTHDNDGNPISVGAVYYNSVELATKFYNGSSWDDPSQSASTSATNALNSENAAALSETNAAASEVAAATSETNAAASESAASISEGNAATSETNAATSETNAAASEIAAAASYDEFDDRYLGPKASDPTLDNDGNALLTGAIYWNTAEDVMKVYTGSLWKLVSTVVEGVYQVTEFTNIATQTTLTITYDVGLAQVLYNGVQLNFSDFTATNGTTIVLASPVALADDVVTVILWGAVTSSSLVGTAAAFDTGVTTGTIPFAEDVVLVDASGNANIDGTVTADGLVVGGTGTGDGDIALKRSYDGLTVGNVTVDSAGSRLVVDTAYSYIDFETEGTNFGMRINNGNVGIGTISPGRKLTVEGGTGDNLPVRVVGGAGSSKAHMEFQDPTTTADYKVTIGSIGDALTLNAGGSEGARLDSAGNLLLGKTAVDNTTVGMRLSGGIGFTSMVRDGGEPLLLNRLTSDGDIAVFRKDGTTVGSWQSRASLVSTIILDPRAGGVGLSGGGPYIYPTNNAGAISDGAIGIGRSTSRFTDLFLSGGVYLGGTAAANKLDDYEEGTWTATLTDGTVSKAVTGSYTKVGNLVHVRASFNNVENPTAFGSTLAVYISGLPFTPVENNIISSRINYSSSGKIFAAQANGSATNISFYRIDGVQSDSVSLTGADLGYYSDMWVTGTYQV